MPIIDLQRQVRQIGRIRIGELAPTARGKLAPSKLTTFRLSSVQRAPIDKAATLYGGDVTEMKSDRSDDRWEVTTAADSIPVVIPPTNHLSQWYEEWDAAGCQRRCDGREAIVMDGRPTNGTPCECDPDQRQCRSTTRLSVILPDLEALGVWRLDTKGYYAATELAAAADLCAVATQQGYPIPARLDLEQRTRRTRDDKGRPQVFKFAVPVLSVDVSIPAAHAILGRVNMGTGEIAPRRAELRAVSEPAQLEAAPQVALPPPGPAPIPVPRRAEQYEADQEAPEAISAEQAADLIAVLNDITDPDRRKAVKDQFVQRFGTPTDLHPDEYGRAMAWAADEAVETAIIVAFTAENGEQPKLIDTPAERAQTSITGDPDGKPNRTQQNKVHATIAELVADPRHPDITDADAYRRGRISTLTGGRTNSITEITAAEIDALNGDLKALQRGEA
jgi:hypothetical protein